MATSEFSDNFNRADEELEDSANWNDTAFGGGAGGDWDVTSNTAKATSRSGGIGGVPLAIYAGGVSSADQYAECVIGTDDTELWMRGDAATAPDNMYRVNFRTGNDDIYISLLTGGSTTVYSTQFTGITINTGDTIKVEVETVSGSQVDIRCYVNGTLEATKNDTDASRLTSGLYLGMGGGIAGITPDDFDCGILGDPAGSTFTPRIMIY